MPELTEHERSRVSGARDLEAQGRQLLSDAADTLREVARELSEAGWTRTDIAKALGVSHQRASQLLAPRG